MGSTLLCTTSDVQLCDCVFGEWRCVFIVYVVVKMQSHFWDNVNFFFKLSPNVISIAYVIFKIPQDEPSRCCITFAYISSRCLTLIILINNCTISSGKFSFSVCLNHILCNVSLLWLHVYGQNANGCYL